MSHERETREPSREPERKGLWTVCQPSTLPLRFSNQQLGESTSSMLQDLDLSILGSQNSPMSGMTNAKWQA